MEGWLDEKELAPGTRRLAGTRSCREEGQLETSRSGRQVPSENHRLQTRKKPTSPQELHAES